MPFSIRHRDDPAPLLPSLPGLEVAGEPDPQVMAAVQDRPVGAMAARLAAGHRPYLVERESATAERFWIIHAPENRPSGAGIRKAGFTSGGEISFDARNRPALRCDPAGAAAPDVLGLPLATGALAPCWRCARAGRRWIMFCQPGACGCDSHEARPGCGS